MTEHRIRAEYAHVAAFAEQREALLKRLRRTGEQEPAPLDRPFDSAAYLRELEEFVQTAERRMRFRARRPRAQIRSAWPLLTALSWLRVRLGSRRVT